MSDWMELVTNEVVNIVGIGMEELMNTVTEKGNEGLLRRFKANYVKLEPEELVAIQDALQHTGSEVTPCAVCKIIASKEFDLAEE